MLDLVITQLLVSRSSSGSVSTLSSLSVSLDVQHAMTFQGYSNLFQFSRDELNTDTPTRDQMNEIHSKMEGIAAKSLRPTTRYTLELPAYSTLLTTLSSAYAPSHSAHDPP